MMNLNRIGVFACGLMIASLVGCTADPALPGRETSPTERAEVAPVGTGEPSPTGSDRGDSTQSPAGTPASRLTVVPIIPGPVIVEETVPERSAVPTPSDPAQQRLVIQAMEDLAIRLSIRVEEIGLVEFKPVVWPDASLGCPQPGMAYIQVLQDGVLIRLSVGKQIYEYHSGSGNAPFLCESVIQ